MSPAAIVRVYRDTPELAKTAYTGATIRVRIEPSNYALAPRQIHWHQTGFTDAPPVIVFECRELPADSASEIEITGVCRGRVEDGKRRGPGIDWYVRVVDCQAVILRAGP